MGYDTDLSDGLHTDCVPDFLGNGSKEFLVDLGNVETLSSCNVFVPLALDLSLVCE